MYIMCLCVKTSMLPFQHCCNGNGESAMHSAGKPFFDNVQIRRDKNANRPIWQERQMLLFGDNIDDMFAAYSLVQLPLKELFCDGRILRHPQIVLTCIDLRVKHGF